MRQREEGVNTCRPLTDLREAGDIKWRAVSLYCTRKIPNKSLLDIVGNAFQCLISSHVCC